MADKAVGEEIANALDSVGSGTFQVNTALTTVGAGAITAAALRGGTITRTGPTAAAADTTPTAAVLIAALPTGAKVGMAWMVRYVNQTAWPITITGDTGVTVSGTAIVPPFSVGEFLVTYATATTVTVYGIGSRSQLSLPPSKYTTAALEAATVAAGALTGAQVVHFENTGTTPAAITTRTAAQMFADIPNCYANLEYTLLVRNSSSGANTLTLTAGLNVTLTGTMTIAQNVTRVFNVKCVDATHFTITSMGVLNAAA
jgi:hypothetical protein